MPIVKLRETRIVDFSFAFICFVASLIFLTLQYRDVMPEELTETQQSFPLLPSRPAPSTEEALLTEGGTTGEESTEIEESSIVAAALESDLDALKETRPQLKTLKVKFGDTPYTFFFRHCQSSEDAHALVRLMKNNKLTRSFRAGNLFYFKETPSQNNAKQQHLERVIFFNDRQKITFTKKETGFVYDATRMTPTKRYFRGTVEDSLYLDAKKLGVPDANINQFARLLSHQVDFQRSIKPGCAFELLLDVYNDTETDRIFAGNFYYGSVSSNGIKKDMYRYESPIGLVLYYSGKAKGTTRKLLKTPVPGARISGRFGFRKRHPVLGYSKMHRGVDFAAVRGTPILAAGDGIIEEARYFGTYGNYIRIKHGPRLHTAYAHMHKFAARMRKGVKIKQGQVIGYVGTTGRSTGPHLHYELHVNRKQVNPLSYKTSSKHQLSEDDHKRFLEQKMLIDQELKKLAKITP